MVEIDVYPEKVTMLAFCTMANTPVKVRLVATSILEIQTTPQKGVGTVSSVVIALVPLDASVRAMPVVCLLEEEAVLVVELVSLSAKNLTCIIERSAFEGHLKAEEAVTNRGFVAIMQNSID